MLALLTAAGISCTDEKQAAEDTPKISHTSLQELPDTGLESGFLHYGFSATDQYLAWVEFYEPRVFLYDLEAGKLIYTHDIEEGEGPGEIETVNALTIDNRWIYLFDQNRGRMLRLDINEPNNAETVSMPVRAFRADTFEDKLVVSTMDENALLSRTQKDGSNANHIGEGELDLERDFKNVLLRNGFVTVVDNHAIFSTRYLPLHFVHDLSSDENVNRVEYETVRDIRNEGINSTGDGATTYVPPDSVDVLFHSAAGVPGQSTRLYKILEGRGDRHGRYRRDRLYVYDWEANDFVGRLELPVAATEVTSNSTAAFVYSDEDFTVYRYVQEE
jgi:hypothetical protein